MDMLWILLQDVANVAATLPMETAAEPEKMNLWTMAVYGGPIMILLALMFAGAVYLFIERLLTINKASKEDKTFMDRIKDYIYDGKIESAVKLCAEANSMPNPTT